MSESRSPHEDIVGSSEVDPEAIRRFKEARRRELEKASQAPSAAPEDVPASRAEATQEPINTGDDYYQHQLDRVREARALRKKGEKPPTDGTQQ